MGKGTILMLTLLLIANIEGSKTKKHVTLEASDEIISAGRFHTCGINKRPGIDVGGALSCWGYNDHGQASPPHGIFVQVSSGHFHSCGLTISGYVECWGSIDWVPSTKTSYDFYKQVSSGEHHVCAIKRRDGNIECWGRNDFGESSPPKGSFRQISSGNGHTCGIRTDQSVTCWGKNHYGESEPPSQTRFNQISVGSVHHVCGITTKGDIVCWGDNRRKQAPHDALKGPFVQVSSGGRSTCAIHKERGLECWGSSQMALRLSKLDDTEEKNEFYQISSGHGHMCAVHKENDKLSCWSFSGANFGAHQVPLGFRSALLI